MEDGQDKRSFGISYEPRPSWVIDFVRSVRMVPIFERGELEGQWQSQVAAPAELRYFSEIYRSDGYMISGGKAYYVFGG